MKKKIVIGSAALLGLFLIGSLVQSRGSRAYGAYSTPVTVMNTTANPAGTLGAELVGRAPYESSVTQNCGSGFSNCQFVVVAIGQGKRVVIENVSGQLSVAPGTTSLPNITFNTGNNAVNGGGVGNYWGIPPGPIVPPSVGGALEVMFNQSVLAYIDGGGSAAVTVNTNHSGLSVVTVSGYIQDCSIVPCPATQHN